MSASSTFTNPVSLQLQASSGQAQVNFVLLTYPTGSLFPISNLMYETAQNEKRRRINILKPSIVASIETSFGNIIKQ
jgi:hypothetical protein